MANIDESIFNSQTAFDVFESSNLGMAIHEMTYDDSGNAINYKFIKVNREFSRIVQIPVQEIEGKYALEVLPKLDRSLLDVYDEIIKTRKPQRLLKYSNRLNVYLDIKAFSPGPGIFISFIDDVTETTLNQIALKQSEEKFRTLHDNMTQGVVYQNRKGEILSANSSAQNILGLSLDQMQGRTSVDPRWGSVHLDGSPFPGDTHPAMITLQTGKTVKNVVMGVYRPETDDKVWINITSVPLFKNNEKNPFQVFTTFDDVTARIEAERALKKSEQDKNLAIEDSRIKSNFLANMSHEIRTPMNGIVGMIDVMSNSENFDANQIEQIRIIKQSSLVLLSILNDILDLSKLEAGKFELQLKPTSVNDSLKQVEELFSAQVSTQNIEWRSELDERLNKALLLDGAKITQVISNLVGNAVKFTSNGSITVRSFIIDQGHSETKLKVEIHDTGTGISEEDQEHIFTEFKQAPNGNSASHKGTGLGLAICKKLIELMGGEIGVNSKPGQGSNFWFSLKAEHAKVSAISEVKADTPAKTNSSDLPKFGLNVLLADDNEVNIKVAELMLKQFGCSVIAARNGEEALKVYDAHPFDLILMDVQMPVMDGVEATRSLRDKHNELPPIIGLSANAMEGDAQKFVALGMDDYLAKPVTVEELKATLMKWFQKPS